MSSSASSPQAQKQNDQGDGSELGRHDGTFAAFTRRRKVRSARSGNLLVEAGMAMGLLTFIGLILLKLSLNILAPRQWAMQQTVTNAYMTYERAYAERIPFENLTDTDSPWPVYPDISQVENVELGRLPGGYPIYGTIVRTRVPSDNNYPIDGGTGTVATNPAAMKVWKVQSIATYTVGTRNYAKSRTILRSQ